MRKGFTMIELIFVIVIIGILAAVAVPRMMATRDDARISAEMASVKQAIDNLGAEYTSQGAFGATSVADADAATKCFDIATTGNAGEITVGVIGAATAECPQAVLDEVTNLAVDNGTTEAAGAAKTYTFAGSRVVR